MPVIEGQLEARGGRYALVVSRFNSEITGRLLAGARDGFIRHGAREADLTVVWVPGACEIPQAAKKLADQGKFRAIVTLGAVIRGETGHYEQVAYAVTRGVADVAMQTGLPVIFGVLTTENLEQAMARAGAQEDNKGWEAALAAIEMANLWDQLR